MKKIYSAQYNLDEIIHYHLFIISPNNSGSTFLKNALASSYSTWNLEKEGQNTYGFCGPLPSREQLWLLWGATSESIDFFSNSKSYNWEKTKKAWYFQAFGQNPEAPVFVEKSPTSLIRVHELDRNFKNARFLFMLRNPYAAVEGIYRRYKEKLGEKSLELAANHIINCFFVQKENIDKFENSIYFSYEDMCEKTNEVEKKIRSLIPVLGDVSLKRKIPVKGIYNEMLRNMNGQQISRLNTNEIRLINNVFSKNEKIINFFGYQILDSSCDYHQ